MKISQLVILLLVLSKANYGELQKNYRITEANYRNDLQEPAIEKKKKKWKNVKYTPSFKDNILNPDLVDMYLIRKDKKRNRILLCVIDVSSKYAGLFL